MKQFLYLKRTTVQSFESKRSVIVSVLFGRDGTYLYDYLPLKVLLVKTARKGIIEEV